MFGLNLGAELLQRHRTPLPPCVRRSRPHSYRCVP